MSKLKGLIFILVFGCNSCLVHATNSPYLQFSQTKIAKGETLVLTVKSLQKEIYDIKVTSLNKNIQLNIIKKPQQLFGLLGVDYKTVPGKKELELSWYIDGKKSFRKYYYTVTDGNYPKGRLKVDPSLVDLSAEDKNRVKKENQLKKDIFSSSKNNILWDSKFIKPINSIVTSQFGVQRIFNGHFKSVHNGVDYRAAIGAKVRSINDGVVKLTKEVFYGGRFIIIDHGMGIFSSYGHLSKYAVRVGQVIKKGEVIGFAGMSGRVNGPHLHSQVIVNSVEVNQLQFIKAVNKSINNKLI